MDDTDDRAPDVGIQLSLPPEQAKALVKFLNRMTLSDVMRVACDEDEAIAMRVALIRTQHVIISADTRAKSRTEPVKLDAVTE